MASDYLDILGIVYEKQQLVFLIRQIGRCSLIKNVGIKCNNSLPIFIDKMPDSIKIFYSLYRSRCDYAENMRELNVGGKDAVNVNSIPVDCCSCNKTDFRLTNK